MEDVLKILYEGFEFGQLAISENGQRFAKVEESLQAYVIRAKETLAHKNLNPKPVKRFMKTIPDDESEEEEESAGKQVSSTSISSQASELRPLRTAKVKANKNLKEVPSNIKLRNENNSVVAVKTERSSSLIKSNSRDSIKENQSPPNEERTERRRSPDEGIQSATESEAPSAITSKRSNSVELISNKLIEIDITGDESSKLQPVTKKTTRKPRTKKQPQEEPIVEPIPLRMTRSKIKQEKISIDASSSQAKVEILMPPPAAPISQLKANESVTGVTKKVGKKKYPMPILVKIEPDKIQSSASEDDLPLSEIKKSTTVSSTQACNETFDVLPPVNETVTVAPAMNETVTLAKSDSNSAATLPRNPHDSLMTEDNDEDVSMEELLPPLPKKQLPPPPVPLKLKKNEVFNPYLSSPVKQRVQAFEKHAQGGTPTKYNTMPAKYSTLKNGTPSKIALYSKTTPLSLGKGIKGSSSTTSLISTSAQKTQKPMKKMSSLSQESLDEIKKNQQAVTMAQLLEEKRKAREEKAKQAQILRDALEKEKRDLALKQVMERDLKYQKIMKEKEEKQRMEALKKKMLKENQAKKFAEEKAKKQEFLPPKPVDQQGSFKMNDSLHLKMQKQIMLDKTAQQKKAESKNIYSFDMLDTDDSTDDESRPSQKRPPQPEWSKKSKRKPMIVMQSHINSNVLDSLFSVQPISVDLRAIFPAIDSRKLIRNSSAIWKTPPKHY